MNVLVLSEGLLRRLFHRDKEKVAWGTMRVFMETKYYSGSVEVQRGQVRVLRVRKDFRGTGEGVK